jgi:hypothetical protein
MAAKPYPEPGEPDDGRHLLATELVARGITGVGWQGLTLDRGLVLPDFSDPNRRSWPPYEIPLAIQLGFRD